MDLAIKIINSIRERCCKRHLFQLRFDEGQSEFLLRTDVRCPEENKQRPRFHIRNSTCTIELVADASYLVNNHENDVKGALREMLIIILQANRILREVDFDNDGFPDNFSLQIGHVEVQKASKTSSLTDGILNEMNVDMDSFRKRPQDYCLSVMFYSGKTSTNVISVAYGGGICKSNENENEPSRNVVILNTFNSEGRRPLFATTWATTMALGQSMGSIERECEVPLSYPPEDDWTLFFSDCRRHNMANALASQGYCLEMLEGSEIYSLQTQNPVEEVTEPQLCGNGKVDLGEECDCGSADDCARRSSCCVPPGQDDECTYDRKQGYECDWSDSCCNHDCKLIPRSWKTFCALGDPSCAPENAYCDGKSPKCPFPIGATSITDGQSCGPSLLKFNGAGTCMKGFCNSTVCRDGGLQDCTCSQESAHECRVCCKKNKKGETDELCVPAEYFGLKPKNGNYFYRYPGTPCQSVRFGHCSRSGTCVQYLTAGAELAAFHEVKVLPLLYVVWIIAWRTLTFKIL
ncbi:disintegrin and metalloproteinase domain-containing protein 10-like [Stegodyphus dumicola]|uniref:disintegrin and metalloproteinase domain-containing protein 10-like n=1 Tax=Stegodyphus dumicola TaxID=202533 RepID=UPI0015AAF4A8|nr:disintegrin and metalloproteinase domain-containing protein 10-like [Stegodyphus dumicola]